MRAFISAAKSPPFLFTLINKRESIPWKIAIDLDANRLGTASTADFAFVLTVIARLGCLKIYKYQTKTMNLAELIKFQVIQRMTGGVGGGGQQQGEQGIYDTVLQLATQCAMLGAIALIDECSKVIPGLIGDFRQAQKEKLMSKIKTSLPKDNKLKETALLHEARHEINSLALTRVYTAERLKKHETEKMNEYVDAILDEVSRLKNVPSMILTDTAQFLINFKDKPVQITEEIFFQLRGVIYNDGNMDSLEIVLLSNTLTATQIVEYVKSTTAIYRAKLTNQLGDCLYFFKNTSQNDNFSCDPRGGPSFQYSSEKEKRAALVAQARPLVFEKVPFFSCKTFHNVCGPEARLVRNRVEFFVKNREWYASKGIPYTLGIMLSGIPGSGKTSIIRAIANFTNRHIVNVNFGSIRTASQLEDLFGRDEITLFNGTQSSKVTIPISKRLYVMEEIDALGAIVLDRGGVTYKDDDQIDGELTLADILTTLDGTVEMPGRMIIITSNYPEKLDKALTRPGRVDATINFGHADPETIREMISLFFSRESYGKEYPDNLSCAEVAQVLFANLPGADDDEIAKSLFNESDIKRKKEESARKKEEQIKALADSPGDAEKETSCNEQDTPDTPPYDDYGDYNLIKKRTKVAELECAY